MKKLDLFVKEILNEAYKPSYPIPGKEDHAYVLANLALGVAKRNAEELNYISSFTGDSEDQMIELGVKLINGTTTPEEYYKKFLSIVKKLAGKDIKFELPEIAKDQILMRLQVASGLSKSEELSKQSLKKVKDDGTLKKESISGKMKWEESFIIGPHRYADQLDFTKQIGRKEFGSETIQFDLLNLLNQEELTALKSYMHRQGVGVNFDSGDQKWIVVNKRAQTTPTERTSGDFASNSTNPPGTPK